MSILPGGRVIAPLGFQYGTGGEPAALAISPSGKILVTANRERGRPSLTVLENGKTWETRHLPAANSKDGGTDSWHSVSNGVAFSGEHSVFVSEGDTGRIALVDLTTGERRRSIELTPNSYTGELVLDPEHDVLYVADLAHFRVVAIDTRSRQVNGTVDLGGAPLALALAPDRRKLYVAIERTVVGRPESYGVCVVDVAHPAAPKVEARIDTPSRSSGIVATTEKVYVSDTDNDSVLVMDARTNQVGMEIPIRIPGLDSLRGVLPMGLAFDRKSGWLLVAEAGINAVGIIDTHLGKVLGHLSAGWFPTRLVLDRDTVYVENTRGRGMGPSVPGPLRLEGSVSMYTLPPAAELAELTESVMRANGFESLPGNPLPLPQAIRHVVVIVKEGLAFDEVLGDIEQVSNGQVMGAPALARFGRDSYVDGRRTILSLHHLNVTPNHHAIAAQWTFSDNFYGDSDGSGVERNWLPAWGHLARHGVSLYRFDEGFDPEVADTDRAGRLIRQIDARFGGGELPQVVWIHLPNDQMATSNPGAGFPYAESYLSDNDYALGRLVEYFSGTKWWGQMAIFITENSVQGGLDHVDAQRTVLLCAGPWMRRNSVSHTNASFPGMLKTIFRLFGVPPLTLLDAAAADLADCFASSVDLSPYRTLPVDPRLYGRPARR